MDYGFYPGSNQLKALSHMEMTNLHEFENWKDLQSLNLNLLGL
jgi:hypothetical protein